jgi:hypothetical protein
MNGSSGIEDPAVSAERLCGFGQKCEGECAEDEFVVWRDAINGGDGVENCLWLRFSFGVVRLTRFLRF